MSPTSSKLPSSSEDDNCTRISICMYIVCTEADFCLGLLMGSPGYTELLPFRRLRDWNMGKNFPELEQVVLPGPELHGHMDVFSPVGLSRKM